LRLADRVELHRNRDEAEGDRRGCERSDWHGVSETSNWARRRRGAGRASPHYQKPTACRHVTPLSHSWSSVELRIPNAVARALGSTAETDVQPGLKRPPHPEVAALLEANRFVRFFPKRSLPRPLDDAGNRLCGWCRAPLGRRSIGWCSDECAAEFWIRCSRTFVIQLVYDRDRGGCAMCGLDTKHLSRVVDRLRQRCERMWRSSCGYRAP